MNMSKLVLMVTEDCNFSCQYCYHSKDEKTMNRATAENAVDYFLPRMGDNTEIYFLGGEPLLNFDLVRHTVEYIMEKDEHFKKKTGFNISTNGSLITPEILEFFNQYHYTIELSFDGHAQELGRQRGSFKKLVDLIPKIQRYPDIRLLVNSVVFPPTVNMLSESIRFILDLGVPHLSLGLALDRRWNRPSIEKLESEYKTLMNVLLDHYQKTGNQPLHFFPDLDSKDIWCCSAGQSQLTVSANGEVWGCALFYEYFRHRESESFHRNYCFGNINQLSDQIEKEFPIIMKHYQGLCQDQFFTDHSRCFLCKHIEHCGVCPVSSAFYWDHLNRVPDYICRINRIAINEKQKFQEELEEIDRRNN
jgi:uncharacterized protein